MLRNRFVKLWRSRGPVDAPMTTLTVAFLTLSLFMFGAAGVRNTEKALGAAFDEAAILRMLIT